MARDTIVILCILSTLINQTSNFKINMLQNLQNLKEHEFNQDIIDEWIKRFDKTYREIQAPGLNPDYSKFEKYYDIVDKKRNTDPIYDVGIHKPDWASIHDENHWSASREHKKPYDIINDYLSYLLKEEAKGHPEVQADLNRLIADVAIAKNGKKAKSFKLKSDKRSAVYRDMFVESSTRSVGRPRCFELYLMFIDINEVLYNLMDKMHDRFELSTYITGCLPKSHWLEIDDALESYYNQNEGGSDVEKLRLTLHWLWSHLNQGVTHLSESTHAFNKPHNMETLFSTLLEELDELTGTPRPVGVSNAQLDNVFDGTDYYRRRIESLVLYINHYLKMKSTIIKNLFSCGPQYENIISDMESDFTDHWDEQCGGQEPVACINC